MEKRMVVIWFPFLMTEWMVRKQPDLKNIPFALAHTERGKRVIKGVNDRAQNQGVYCGMVVADCKALVPELQVFDYDESKEQSILKALAEWCLRYTPFVSVYQTNALILDASGCTHLWGNDQMYLNEIHKRFQLLGYSIRLAMAGTIGCAWALSHYGKNGTVTCLANHSKTISSLPPAALRLEKSVCNNLEKLGFTTVASFMELPRTALRRRFGPILLSRLDQALGSEMELITPICPPFIYEEHLPSLEPIRTATGIEIAIKLLLEKLCDRLMKDGKGLRTCQLRCYRVDGNIQKIEIGTHQPSRHAIHIFKLFEIKISQIQPGMGIELFILEASMVEELAGYQEAMWAINCTNDTAVAELIDKLTGKIGNNAVHRFIPSENYWPEKSIKDATSLLEKPGSEWRVDIPRPLHLLPKPERIEVSVPIPDYPPLLFRHQGNLHTVKKADGPERIEQEWWCQQGLYRDYYCVEDEQGARFWVFRSGNYYSGNTEWFLHGFFA